MKKINSPFLNGRPLTFGSCLRRLGFAGRARLVFRVAVLLRTCMQMGPLQHLQVLVALAGNGYLGKEGADLVHCLLIFRFAHLNSLLILQLNINA